MQMERNGGGRGALSYKALQYLYHCSNVRNSLQLLYLFSTFQVNIVLAQIMEKGLELMYPSLAVVIWCLLNDQTNNINDDFNYNNDNNNNNDANNTNTISNFSIRKTVN